MRTSTVALAIALCSFTISAAAEPYTGRQEQPTIRGQSGTAASKSQEEALPQGIPGQGATTTGRKIDTSKMSKQFMKAIVELQNAVNAKDAASSPGKLAAAQAIAKTPEEKFLVASNQTKAALDANDNAAIRAGIDAMRASGAAETPDLVSRYNNLGKRYYDAKQIDQAADAFEQSLSVDANNADALKLLASLRDAQGRKADAVALMAKSLAAAKTAGVKPKENDYKFAARIAYDSKSPAAAQITTAWLADYPTTTNWRDALRIYRDVNALEGDSKIDVMRLARAANAMVGEGDYFSYVSELVTRGYLNEAKAVLDEGAAKKAIDVNKSAFKQFAAKLAKAPSRATVDSVAKAALGGSSGKAAMEAGDTLYGLSAFAEAAPLFKAAATKGGVDTNLANLRLGMALARAGDKAGATAALNAVGGAQAGIAKYWLIWVNGQA